MQMLYQLVGVGVILLLLAILIGAFRKQQGVTLERVKNAIWIIALALTAILVLVQLFAPK